MITFDTGVLIALERAMTIDAQVMATAALFGAGAVLTADLDDLARFTRHFPKITIEPL